MNIRAVLFDFEGTLVDFQWKLDEGEAALRQGFAGLGYDPRQLASETYATMWNRALNEAPEREAQLRAALDPIYDRYDLDALTRWQLRPEAVPALARLQDMGLLLAVVSNIGRLALDQAVQRFLLSGVFAAVLSRDDVRLMKPAAEGIAETIRRLGVSRDETLFVGDSSTDVRAGAAAGVRVAIVPAGESTPEALIAAGEHILLSSLADLPQLVGAPAPTAR